MPLFTSVVVSKAAHHSQLGSGSMQHPHTAFPEAETPPFNADFTPDHTSLFLATLLVAAAAYLASAVLAWPTWSNRRKAATQHKATVIAGALPANSCTQTSAASPTTPVRPAEAASSGPLTVDEQFEQLLQPTWQSQPAVHQQADILDNLGSNRPFRFRAPDFTTEDSDAQVFASPQQPRRPKQQVQFFTPPPANKAPWQPQAEQQQTDGWDPELLDRCALSSPYISSVEALQFSPKYRSHISSVRGRRLQYETAEAHKLKIYKALRDVDPPGFQQLFSRKDVQEYDEQTPSMLLSAFECLASSALTLGLLLLPSLLSVLNPYAAPAALLWCCLYLFSASRGCLSPVTWLLSIHPTYGEYQMLPSGVRMVAAVVLEAGVVVLTAGMGVLVTLLCRMLTQQRQSFGERVLQLVPMKEFVRPMHFNRLPPAGSPVGTLFE